MSQLPLFDGLTPMAVIDGRALKEEGMQKAVDHANAVTPDWSEQALQMLERFPQQRFMVEELREWAYAQGLPRPPSERAWGGVTAKARKLGLIMHGGYQSVKNPKAHCTPASCWVRVGTMRKAG